MRNLCLWLQMLGICCLIPAIISFIMLTMIDDDNRYNWLAIIQVSIAFAFAFISCGVLGIKVLDWNKVKRPRKKGDKADGGIITNPNMR